MKHYLQKRNNDNRELSLFDAFDDFFKPMFYDAQSDMKTDIKETEKEYQLEVEAPGYKKENINVSLEDGYLTVTCTKHEKEEGDRYIRKETSRSCSRSYFVGEEVSEKDVKAKYDNGILTINVPKAAPKQIQSRNITIE